MSADPVSLGRALVDLVLDVAEGASEREREEMAADLAEAEAGLRAIAPNGPRIRALVAERRRLREALALCPVCSVLHRDGPRACVSINPSVREAALRERESARGARQDEPTGRLAPERPR